MKAGWLLLSLCCGLARSQFATDPHSSVDLITLAASGSVRGTTIRTTRGTPKTSHDACTPGDSWDDDDFHFHCTSKGQIKRTPLASF